ncbi:2OG-Fe(II) oxygenase [Cutibacterium sp. WCA-380-WT-3A]|uniref:2OG-Fe(II) oxygenase n=1 Tax=Cutibacterium porci TaxID=2605781 RepID=A0A7K0J7T7_9ACTN|nr:2OG-Fe(II) oxygenase [Cutibacterium porci]
MAVQFGIGHYRPIWLGWMTVKGLADATVTDLTVPVTMGSRSPRNTSFQFTPRNRRIVIAHRDHASS